MGHSERKCDISDEAALKGICDVFRRLRDKGEPDASAQCDEVIAICCHQLAYVYGTKPVDVIQWLYNPQHDLAPKSFAAFVKENSLSEAFRLHFSKQPLEFMREVNPHDTIIVNNATKPTPPEDPEHSEVAGSHELAVWESTYQSKTRQSGMISEEILTHNFDTFDEISIPEYDINSFPDSKSDSDGTTLLPTSDSDVQQTRSPSPQVLAQEGCHTDHGPKLNCNTQGTVDGGPTTPDTNQVPKPAGLAKTLQSYEAFLALAPTLYSLSYKTNAISTQLPLIRDSKSGCLELLRRTPHNAQRYHGCSNDYHNLPIRTVLPDPGFDGRKPSDTRGLEDWAVVSRIGVRKCPRRLLRPPLIKLPPLKHSQNKTRMPGQLSLPVLWKRTPLTNASARQSTCASTTAIGRALFNPTRYGRDIDTEETILACQKRRRRGQIIKRQFHPQ
ncbi:hypothetical protein VFPPC_10587 [Pochonia chlamydosporia 170]|uniref:Uncharacterized protein n=1 Tax=Pochonia chlamydosporia 170 TaxID=1380566 RepID=A0A179F455_METCM|nr:hypothetical protein VFPPC_10587 [Pochonia chlamydosporia 170]OAQ60151.1 hypothetical protein VFPPC_10587 [Pochonia chlamydosporia 170]